MAKQVINIGAAANDGTGTPLRTSFDYTNQNFTELYNGSGIGTSTNTQVLFNDSGVANGDAGLVYNKTTDALSVGGTLGVTGITTLTGAATVQGLTVGKGASAIASNTAFGISALAAVTAASNCTAFGNSALLTVGTGTRNTAVGAEALKLVSTGGSNTGVGLGSLRDVTGSYNTGIGDISLYQLASGDNSTACGYGAGQYQTAGSNNAFFGANTYADDPIASNQYIYGDTAVATHKFRAGDVVLGTGNVVVASAKGIDFSATAGAGTSELLNDYEEGTWSPTPSGEVNLTSVVSVSAQYTKVGRLVTVSGQVTATVTLASTLTYFTLPSLPFANGTVTVGTVFADGSLKAGGAQVFGSALSGYFPAASALGSGAAVFYYSVTYSV